MASSPDFAAYIVLGFAENVESRRPSLPGLRLGHISVDVRPGGFAAM
jgi:hypothetical protein